MKRAIWAAFLAVIVSVFAVSCSKTSMNSAKLVGTWKLISQTVTLNGVSVSEPFSDNVTVEIIKGGTLTITETEGSKTYTVAGTWTVVDDEVIVSITTGGSTTYHIESLDSKNMVLSHTEAYDSSIYTISETFVKI